MKNRDNTRVLNFHEKDNPYSNCYQEVKKLQKTLKIYFLLLILPS